MRENRSWSPCRDRRLPSGKGTRRTWLPFVVVELELWCLASWLQAAHNKEIWMLICFTCVFPPQDATESSALGLGAIRHCMMTATLQSEPLVISQKKVKSKVDVLISHVWARETRGTLLGVIISFLLAATFIKTLHFIVMFVMTLNCTVFGWKTATSIQLLM